MMQCGALLKKCLPLKSKMKEAVRRFPPLMWMRSVRFLISRCKHTYSRWRLGPPRKAGGKWRGRGCLVQGDTRKGKCQGRGSVCLDDGSSGRKNSAGIKNSCPHLTVYTRASEQYWRRKQWPSYPHPHLPLVEASLSTQVRAGATMQLFQTQVGWWLLCTHTTYARCVQRLELEGFICRLHPQPALALWYSIWILPSGQSVLLQAPGTQPSTSALNPCRPMPTMRNSCTRPMARPIPLHHVCSFPFIWTTLVLTIYHNLVLRSILITYLEPLLMAPPTLSLPFHGGRDHPAVLLLGFMSLRREQQSTFVGTPIGPITRLKSK